MSIARNGVGTINRIIEEQLFRSAAPRWDL